MICDPSLSTARGRSQPVRLLPADADGRLPPPGRTISPSFNPDRIDHDCDVGFPFTSERYEMTLSLLLLREDEAGQWR